MSVTLAAVLIGLFTIYRQGASYSSNFSTIFRVGRVAAATKTEIHPVDSDGADPLPYYLKRAEVRLRPATTDEGRCQQQNRAEDRKIPIDPRPIIAETENTGSPARAYRVVD
jgi:hypothetical protein